MVRCYPGDEIALGTEGMYLMGRKISGYQQIGGTEDICDAIVSDDFARGVESELEMIADSANSIEGRCVTCCVLPRSDDRSVTAM
jgi:hypothetical protein